MKIISWNVNGIRAVQKKGFLDLLERESPDALCVQETKISPTQITQELQNPAGYYSQWVSANRPGYSGVATFSKQKPLHVQKELGNGRHDSEGRLLLTEFPNFVLVNVYIPNGGLGDHRIQYKLDYYDEMLDFLERLRAKGKNLVICGDINTAHEEIDLARPKENENVTGFLPVERAWLDKFIAAGYVDTFRHFHPEEFDAYTWWSYRSGARVRNVGWRIDYFFVNKEFLPHVKKAWILSEVGGSDHCPIGLEVR
ncbi:exodeoxyribonuclease III [Candidatus Peregrinibacteria bacterium RIFCSPLOWO2_02_FULL_48_14]|nr:MAG: exodeoxyribonuclease III [Candidatus Peregrinibacteria bacterium RIFCSPLOWO2_02_FULL_48_14]